MKKLGNFKTAEISKIRPLMVNSGPVEEVPTGSYRLVKNITAEDDRSACRLPGWKKFGDPGDNQDLHDQLVGNVVGYDYLTATYTMTTVIGYDYSGYSDPYTWQPPAGSSLIDVYCGYPFGLGISFSNPGASGVSGNFISEFMVGYPYSFPGGWSGEFQDASYSIVDYPYPTCP